MGFIYTFLLMAGFWILLSGKLDAFHLALGGLSCLLVSVLSSDLLFPKGSRLQAGVIVRFLLYLPWLVWQIVLANIDVARLALSPDARKAIDPRIFRFKTKLKSDTAKVAFANSITLTPGTITVKIEGDEFCVHGINAKAADALPGEMEERIARVFERNG